MKNSLKRLGLFLFLLCMVVSFMPQVVAEVEAHPGLITINEGRGVYYDQTVRFNP